MLTRTLEDLWSEYLEQKPTKRDLRYIVSGFNLDEKVRELAWKEFKKKKLTKEEVLEVVALSRNEKLQKEAWEMLNVSSIGEENADFVVRCLPLDHPISREIRKELGRGKAQIFKEIEEVTKRD